MKNLFYTILVFIFFCCSVKGQSNVKCKNREQLKEYFLCCCIDHGFKTASISDIDDSKSIYFDILKYELPAMQKIDSLAKTFVNSIEISEYENRKTRGIVILSIEEYKSKRIDKFIKSMDVYMLKDY